MARHAYRLGRRAEAAEETRRRIVEASFALHTERGIVATSMKQIAQRAGVSVGTVYHHFPTYDDAILACGQHVAERVPPPDPGIFEGLASTTERVRRLAAEVFGYYERLPALERVRCDQHLLPVLRRFVEFEEEHRATLVREALRPSGIAEERRVRLVAALLDMAVYHGLVRTGFTTGEAAEEIARVVLASLAAGTGPPPDGVRA